MEYKMKNALYIAETHYWNPETDQWMPHEMTSNLTNPKTKEWTKNTKKLVRIKCQTQYKIKKAIYTNSQY